MIEHDAVTQAPISVETDSDGVVMNVCQFDVVYYAKVSLRMHNSGVANANILPYVIVKADADTPNAWTVRDSGRTDNRGTAILIGIDGPGRYRAYIKEPTETFPEGATFSIQQHALADGTDSGREVQPLFELNVVENENCSLSGRKVHPNALVRARGNGNDQIAADGAALHFAQNNTTRAVSRALDFGEHIVTHQLWADASRAYGTSHPVVQNSRFRDALRSIYGEQLVAGSGAGLEEHNRVLRSGDIEVEFDHQATNGGRGRLSFCENNGQPNNRMTADEALRRTHPATMEFLLQMMADLDVSYVRSTGAWRPHIGSTRHRYASAIDLTHLRATVPGTNNEQYQVTIHLHRATSPDSNPLRTQPQEAAERSRMRTFSHRFHAYIAQARADGQLGWLGGPWQLSWSQIGIEAPDGTTRDDIAIRTDNTHVHHVHLSVGTDQP